MTEPRKERRATPPVLVQTALPTHGRPLYRPRALQGYLEPDAPETMPSAPAGEFARHWLLIAALLVAGGVCAACLAQRLGAPAPYAAAARG